MTFTRQYAAIIFDRDGTLLKISPRRAAALSARFVQVAPQLTPEAVTDYWQRWPGPWPITAAAEPAFWEHFWARVSEEHIALSGEQRLALATIALDYHTMFEAYPDAAPLVRELHTRGMRMAVLTNFELPSVDRTLEAAGFDLAWFDLQCSSESLVARKPDPRAFLAVAAMLELAPDRCLLVDDLPEHCIGAQAAGMGAVYLDRAGIGAASNLTRCASLAELPALLGLYSALH